MIKVDLSHETIKSSGNKFMKNKRRNHSAQLKCFLFIGSELVEFTFYFLAKLVC